MYISTVIKGKDMKKQLLLLLPILFISGSDESYKQTIVDIEPKELANVIVAVDSQEVLINALINVESRGNDSAIGDRHLVGNEAVGALQIRPIMVREVNRILKIQKSDKRFKLKDRFDRTKTVEMFLIWKNYHHPKDGFEVIARNWNGGPRGYKSSKTEKYWVKVQQELDI